METPDLHEEFINVLNERYPKRSELITKVADLLTIEKDAAYRRVSGKVNFSIREMGVIAGHLNISIDKLMRKQGGATWMSFLLDSPLETRSMDAMMDDIIPALERLSKLTRNRPVEMGSINTTVPLEFYITSPVLTKFMFFKWGHFFVGTDEFDDYGSWVVPEKVNAIRQKVENIDSFDQVFYIWDDSVIWTLAREVFYIYRMRVITTEEKNDIRDALKEMLHKIEKALNGTYTPKIRMCLNAQFYVASLHMGFCCNYFASPRDSYLNMRTNYSLSVMDESPEDFEAIKKWVDSFRKISTLLSDNGRIGRKVFFDDQHRIIDILLR